MRKILKDFSSNFAVRNKANRRKQESKPIKAEVGANA
jgi:hypothetical protein